MESLSQLEFEFNTKNEVPDISKNNCALEPQVIFEESTSNIFFKSSQFFTLFKSEHFCKQIVFNNIENRVEIVIELHKVRQKRKIFWTNPSILQATQQECEILKSYFTAEKISRSVIIPVLKKYFVHRPCHWKLNWTEEGKFYNLQSYFDKLNQQYFGNKLTNKISWSISSSYPIKRRVKTFRLGYFCRGCSKIFISPSLDNCRIPEKIVEVIVYHEMVHAFIFKFYPSLEKPHDKKFKKLYCLHPHIKEVEKLLKSPGIYKILRKR
ncbi:MAG TPA: SprT-like domain-containing protein [Candidatus Hydrogenedens sp.]|nr:SprT-like domain-containing protein [Candidatus Hydrogenedens sp.]